MPFEAMALLEGQPCSRVPTVFYLSALHESHRNSSKSVARVGVKKENIFYILNPNQDLKRTQERLEPSFQQLSLGDGVVGEWPTSSKLQTALSSMDAVMYCGHGSRLKNMSHQEIERLNVRAVPLLFGCNSGKLERIGRSFDPIGGALSYLIATAPCLLGFLWSVTGKRERVALFNPSNLYCLPDLDVDKWTVSFLEHWLGSNKDNDSGSSTDFVRCVAERRGDFIRLANSAATVVYGLPAFYQN